MQAYLKRQLIIINEVIDDYRSSRTSLNSLVQSLEAMTGVLEDRKLLPDLRAEMNSMACDIEVINAVTIVDGKDLTERHKTRISSMLAILESRVNSELAILADVDISEDL